MRSLVVALGMVLCPVASAVAQVEVDVGIGVDLPAYPQLVQVPGQPVYYAPHLDANYFFYDGLYWVYAGDSWHTSSWYNGPWSRVAPERVPVYVLRVPVRYYRQPPPYFRGWRREAPPRWGERWGNDWERGHPGWDRWDRRHVPRPAPLPAYQRRYSGSHYPQREQQQALHTQHYRYQPRDDAAHRTFEAQGLRHAPPSERVVRAAPHPQRPEPQRGERDRDHRHR
jgi:hypothetical protein